QIEARYTYYTTSNHLYLIIEVLQRIIRSGILFDFFFFNDTATTEIYTLSLHDALPIFSLPRVWGDGSIPPTDSGGWRNGDLSPRSEEHTSELQSRGHLVCRLLLEKKKHSFHHEHYLDYFYWIDLRHLHDQHLDGLFVRA